MKKNPYNMKTASKFSCIIFLCAFSLASCSPLFHNPNKKQAIKKDKKYLGKHYVHRYKPEYQGRLHLKK